MPKIYLRKLNKIFNGKGGGSDTFSTVILDKIAVNDIKASIEEILK